jgi:hypothetical protein
MTSFSMFPEFRIPETENWTYTVVKGNFCLFSANVMETPNCRLVKTKTETENESLFSLVGNQ